MMYSEVIFSLNYLMRWAIKVHDVFMLCFYHVGGVVYGLWLWCLWRPRYIIVVRSSKCPPIDTIHWDLVILDRLRCFVSGLSSSDGFYDDLAMFKVNFVEVCEIYIQYHDLGEAYNCYLLLYPLPVQGTSTEASFQSKFNFK